MTIIDDLKAAGIECPEVAAYEECVRLDWHAPIWEVADAAIDALVRIATDLKAELDAATALNGQWMDESTAAVIRAEKADAERDKARDLLNENALLRTCGTCLFVAIGDDRIWCGDEVAEPVLILDRCHHSPSRWVPYWDEAMTIEELDEAMLEREHAKAVASAMESQAAKLEAERDHARDLVVALDCELAQFLCAIDRVPQCGEDAR